MDFFSSGHCVEFLHVKPGKGATFVRTTLRNFVTGNQVEKTFRDGSKTTYEEVRLNEVDIGDRTKWLKEGMDCTVLFWKGKVIDFELPINVKLKVVEVDPGLKGDTAQGGSKPATVDTGVVVNVPLEDREKSVATFAGIDFFGGGSLTKEEIVSFVLTVTI
ncbi:hypothetical protein ACS0TY_027002 [Phlomoides rotata]